MAKPDSDDKLFDIMYSCRSMRRLKPDPVPDEVLLQLVDAALQGPSGSNAQNWHFIIVKDRETKQKLQELWKSVWAFYGDTVASAPLREGETAEAREKNRRAGTYMVDHLVDAPAIVFVAIEKDEVLAQAIQKPSTLTAALKHFGLGGAVKVITHGSRSSLMAEAATAYPVVQNLLLAARALGLGAVLTTPHLFVPGRFEEILGAPSNVTLAAVIPVGYPKGRFGPVSRPAPESVVSWDRYRS